MFTLFLLLSIVWTWPLAAELASRVTPDLGDPLLNTWILWWSTQEIPFTAAWWNAPFFYPMPGALALSEHLAGLAIVSAPVMAAGAPPIAAYNVTLILTYACSGFFSYLLVLRLTGSRTASVISGIAFGFAPYRASQLSHIQVLASQWMPLMLLAMHAYLDEGRRRWLLILACAWVVQALSNGYYLLFMPILVAMWLAWFVDWRHAPARGVAVGFAFALGSILLVPVALKYLEVHHAVGLTRSPAEMRGYSPTFASFARPPHLLRFWPDVWDTAEGHLFPGVTPVAIVAAAGIVALTRWRRGDRAPRSPFLFYVGATLVLWLLAMGPAPPDAGWRAVFHPYALLVHLPGFSGLRVPARFAMLACACLTTAAGLAFARVAPRRALPMRVLAAIVLVGLVVDGWMQPLPLSAPPGRMSLPEIPRLAVLELPALEPAVQSGAMYRALRHRRPLVTGYSGFFPPHINVLADGLARHDPSVLPALARGQPILIAIDNESDPAHDLRTLIEGIPGVTFHVGTSGGLTYLLAAQPRERIAPLGSRWEAAVTLQPREHVVFDLGENRVVRALEFPLRDQYRELGARVAIEASSDGAAWTTAWEDWTGGLAVTALLREPRLGLIRFQLPDITARYLRVHPAPEWMWREMAIYGPR